MTAPGATPPLLSAERPAAGDPAGLLVLHHGRGADERDLLGLADVLDPERRLHVVTPRAPFTLAGSPGYHWYVVERVGHPDHDTFHRGFAALAAFHDALWAQTGIPPGQTVLGGFSQGAVMSYALALSPARLTPTGLFAFSGFLPVVDGWALDPESARGLATFVAHGRADPVIEVGFGRAARRSLERAGAEIDYQETDGGHQIAPVALDGARAWLDRRLSAVSSPGARR
jgi:phospholipase/carboxylesterase